MDNSTFWILAVIYLVAGTVILKCFHKMKMQLAFGCFSVLFVVFSLYIPAVLGTGMLEAFSRPILLPAANESVQSFLIACVPYFTMTSVVAIVFALIVGIATLILSFRMVHYVVRILKGAPRQIMTVRRNTVPSAKPAPAYKPKRIYLAFCRLLN